MRIGQNPAKLVKNVTQPKEVTVAVLSYIPTLGGYYSQSLEVLKFCLKSILENTRIPYDLLVFDNASCHPVKELLRNLQEDGAIQYLVLSEKNYGKAGAWNFIFGAAPGKYIAYADSDVFHHPGWLEPQIQLLERFPNTGMVTGMPMWTPEEFSSSTVNWAENTAGVTLHRGKNLEWEDYWKHARSLGADEDEARAHYDSIESLLVSQKALKFFVGAAHFQFVAPKAVLQSLLPIPSNRPMGEVRMLDISMNQAGYLRFSTTDWLIEHMGNRLSPEISQQSQITKAGKTRNRQFNFWKRRYPRRIVSWVYHKTFELLYRN